MKRMHFITLSAVVAIAFAGTAWAANPPGAIEKKSSSTMTQPGKLDQHDQDFLKKAAEINLTEIELGKVAERLSTDPNVKKLGSHLIKDHSEAKQKLDRLAASKGVSLPNEIPFMDRHSLSSLEKQQGDKFNKEFLSFNIKGHEKAIDLFRKEASRTQDPDIKAWAEKMLPNLKNHLAMAQSSHTEAVGEKSQIQHQKMQQQQQQQLQQKQKQQQPYLQEKRGY